MLARILHPRFVATGGRDELANVGFLRRKVERHHHRAERPDVLNPSILSEECGEVIVGDHHDRVLERVPREYDRAHARFIGLVRDSVEARQIEHVVRQRRHDPVETTRLKRMEHAVEIAEALGEGFSWKGL